MSLVSCSRFMYLLFLLLLVSYLTPAHTRTLCYLSEGGRGT